MQTRYLKILMFAFPKNIDLEKTAEEFKDMALNYYRDSLHFYENDEYANALGALEVCGGVA